MPVVMQRAPARTSYGESCLPGGYGFVNPLDTMAAFSRAVQQPVVYGNVAGGVAASVVSRALPPKIGVVVGLGGLGAVGYGIFRLVQMLGEEKKAMEREKHERTMADAGSGAVRGTMSDVDTVLRDGASASDSAKRGVLSAYSTYESARRTDTFWRRLKGTALDPLLVTNMTADQAATLTRAFSRIPRADRGRLVAIYQPGHLLADLG